MEVTVPPILNVLNGSDARLPCTFNSCYKVNHKQFSLNWTYQQCNNCSEEMVSPVLEAGLGEQAGAPQHKAPWSHHRPLHWTRAPEDSGWAACSGGFDTGKGWMGASPVSLKFLAHSSLPCPQFLQFRMKIINLKLERFQDRVEFSGNPSKYDVSVMLRNVQLEDKGIYNCYIMNPPDRHRGHGKIHLDVIMEVLSVEERKVRMAPGMPQRSGVVEEAPFPALVLNGSASFPEPPERDSTVAVIVGASVGGFLAVVILVLMVVKCVRRKKEQKLSTDDLKTEEEGKTDGEGNADDGAK
ncbi:Sodium channel subunit beta-2 [Plecturocebus cupreus]